MRAVITFIASHGLYLLIGGGWIAAEWLIPREAVYLHNTVILLLAGVFVGIFIWLVISRVRRLLSSHGNLWSELIIASVNVLLLCFAFGAVYSHEGITNTTPSHPVVIHDLASSVYFSMVTFTTLGYGGLQPHGLVPKVLTCIQPFIGYVVLALFASSIGTLLQQSVRRRENPSPNEDPQDARRR